MIARTERIVVEAPVTPAEVARHVIEGDLSTQVLATRSAAGRGDGVTPLPPGPGAAWASGGSCG